MKKYLMVLIVVQVFLLVESGGVKAQSLPVGSLGLEDVYRRGQLLGLVDSTASFCARPFFPTEALKLKDGFDPFNELEKDRFTKFDGTFRFDKGKGVVKLLPVAWLNQYNSHHPEGLNDGAMIPAKGYQTMVSMGFYAQYGPLSIQLRPEVVYAANENYPGFPHTRKDPVWADQLWYLLYHSYFNKIDLPERFGEKSYNRISWGQSSIRLSSGPISFGLSTENLWWGPGLRNSLVMTNSAPGFTHLTLNTIKPIKTPIGSIEGQIIAGKLEKSGFTPPEPERSYFETVLYVPKPDDWRYINGMVISYQPKWVPGLFLGFTRSLQVYSKDMGKTIGDILPVFSPFSKKNAGSAADSNKKRDQHSSVFMRWVWLKANAEVYAEYGRQDNYWNLQDLEVEASYSAAYIVGFRKLVPLKKKKNEYIQVNLELTQLELNSATRSRKGQGWYLNDQVRAGYTNQGQLLGAGIGTGSNLQTLNVSWVKGLKQLGIQFERFVHNNDFHNSYVPDIRIHWVDISATLHADWNYKHLVFTAKLGFVNSMNYEWIYNVPQYPDFWIKGEDDLNIHGQLGLMYRF